MTQVVNTSGSFSVLLLRYDKIGDLLISTPVLRALRERYPYARIDVLAGKHNLAVARTLAGWNIGVVEYQKSLPGLIRLLIQRRGTYDVIVDMMDNASRTSTLLLRLLAPASTVGFANGRTHPITHAVDLPRRSEVHIVDCMTELLRPFSIDPSQVSHRPSLPGVDALRGSAGADILVHISAGKASLWWGQEQFETLLRTLRTDYPGARIVLGSAPHERAIAESIAATTQVELLPVASSFVEYAGHVQRARLLITPDTSIVHVSSMFGTPSVVLYAQPHPDRLPWYPYHTPHRAIVATDPHGIESISAAQVVSALRSLRDEISSREVFERSHS